MNIENLSKYIIFYILNNLGLEDVYTLSKTCKKFLNMVCKNDEFWRTRAISVLGYDKDKIVKDSEEEWYKWYLNHAGCLYILDKNDRVKSVNKGVMKIFPSACFMTFIDDNGVASHIDGGIVKSYRKNIDIISSGGYFSDSCVYLYKHKLVVEGKIIDTQYKIDYISNGFVHVYFIISGYLYYAVKSSMHKGIKKFKYNGMVKYIKNLNDDFLFITYNDDLYIGMGTTSVKAVKNVKSADFNISLAGHGYSCKDKYNLYWIDNDDNLYSSHFSLNILWNERYLLEEEIKKNRKFLMKDASKVRVNSENIFILSYSKKLYKSQDLLDENVDDVECNNAYTFILKKK